VDSASLAWNGIGVSGGERSGIGGQARTGSWPIAANRGESRRIAANRGERACKARRCGRERPGRKPFWAAGVAPSNSVFGTIKMGIQSIPGPAWRAGGRATSPRREEPRMPPAAKLAARVAGMEKAEKAAGGAAGPG